MTNNKTKATRFSLIKKYKKIYSDKEKLKKERLEQLKKAKLFTPLDILPYVFLVVVIVSLFLGLVILKPTQTLENVKVFVDDKANEKLVLSYDFTEKKIQIESEFLNYVKVEEKTEGIYLTVYKEDLKAFNKIFISNDNKISVVDANCSYHKDCVTFSPITKGGEVIICVPHNLQIIGNGQSEVSDEPILG